MECFFSSAASLSGTITALINICIRTTVTLAIRHILLIINKAVIILIFINHLILFLTVNSYLCVGCYPPDLYVA